MTGRRSGTMSMPATVAAVATLLALAGWLVSSRAQHVAAPTLTPEAVDSLAWLVDLNAAPAHELTLLPRIGPTLANRIVTDRTEAGPFASIDELLRVRGIGPRTLHGVAAEIIVQSDPPMTGR